MNMKQEDMSNWMLKRLPYYNKIFNIGFKAGFVRGHLSGVATGALTSKEKLEAHERWPDLFSAPKDGVWPDSPAARNLRDNEREG